MNERPPNTGAGARAVEPSGPVDANVRLPGSKSITNRALVCAALAPGTSTIRGWLDAADTRAMIEGLQAMGVAIDASVDGDELTVAGGALSSDVVSIDAHQSGTTSRFLLPVAALDGVARRVDGDAQLRARPMADAFEALRALGARVTDEGVPGFLPVVVEGPISGGDVVLPGDVSSQFLSGLLLSGPMLPTQLTATASTSLISASYVEMTASVMRAFGADVDAKGSGSWVVAPTGYRPADFVVEPDASAASYAWAAAVVTGGTVTVEGLSRESIQGDVAFASVLERMGATVVWSPDGVTVTAGPRLEGIDVDMADLSDTVPTLAVVAAFADTPTTIRGVGFIRHKESDRLAAPVAELRRLGVDAEETDDGLTIRPGPMTSAVVETYDDHRMAMAFALAGLRQPGVSIAGPDCVAKTFPGYWSMLEQLRAGSGPPERAV